MYILYSLKKLYKITSTSLAFKGKKALNLEVLKSAQDMFAMTGHFFEYPKYCGNVFSAKENFYPLKGVDCLLRKCF